MNHRDEELSDVVVVLKDEAGMNFEAAVAGLKNAGLSVSDVVEDEGVVEGTIDAGKVKGLEKLAFVDDVRTVFTYTADFPAGDPRNQDPDDDPDPEVDDAGA